MQEGEPSGRHAAKHRPQNDEDIPGLGEFVKAALLRALPRQGVAVVAGLLLCASFPPIGLWYTAIVAFALLAWIFTREVTKMRGGFGYGFLFGLAFYLPLLPWISGLVGMIPWLVLATVQSVYPGLFGMAAVAVRRLPGWPVWLAGLWAAQEWLKCSVPFGGFPWGVVGFGQTNGPLLPIVRFGGVPLLSFAAALAGFCLTAIALEVYQWWRRDDTTTGSEAPPAVVVPGVCICLVLFGTAAIWPGVRHSGSGAGNDPTVTVAAVQGNVPRLGLDFNVQRRAVLDNHVRETVRLADEVHAGRAIQPQFVIWPENSSDVDPLQNDDAAQQITVAAQAIGAPILVGAVLAKPEWSPDNPVSTNTVIVWDPADGPGERHDKQIVQPFGEYLPWRGFFRHLSSYADRAGYFVPGKGSGVVHAAGVPVGVTTCWEVIFDRAARESVLNGAQMLAVPSNNATFNQAMSEQQLAFGKERAVEHDRYVVVAGTTGISAVIAPDGRELARTPWFQPAYLDKQIRLKTALTPATRWGPFVQAALVAVAVGALIVAILQNGGFMRRRGPMNGTHRGPPDTDKGAT
ncbi:MAG: apolipoprotein N-acyltransferase [Mycobacteriaceae bacterium]|nr:apolipoprotein N-acyltransferase [Mycobacteriaceae bacterium]